MYSQPSHLLSCFLRSYSESWVGNFVSGQSARMTNPLCLISGSGAAVSPASYLWPATIAFSYGSSLNSNWDLVNVHEFLFGDFCTLVSPLAPWFQHSGWSWASVPAARQLSGFGVFSFSVRAFCRFFGGIPMFSFLPHMPLWVARWLTF